MIGSESDQSSSPLTINVSPEQVVIDSVLRSLLERRGLDLHDVARRLIAHEWHLDPDMSDMKISWARIGDDLFFLVEELDIVVMSCSIPLRSGFYDGRSVWLNERLPQSLCLSLTGRRLGDFIATGNSELDNRVINSASPQRTSSVEGRSTRVEISRDLIELGPPSRSPQLGTTQTG
jgi:hypothetical protein